MPLYPWQERWREYLASQEAKRLKENQAKGRHAAHSRMTPKESLLIGGLAVGILALILLLLSWLT